MKEQNNMDQIRHSLAHLLAYSVLEMYPDALPTIGPAIDNGFYYDFEFPTEKPGEEDLAKIEKVMKKTLPTWKDFERIETNEKEAKEKFAKNPYKLELINEITEKGEPLTFYKSGEFTDLCRGGHFDDPSKIPTDSFMLSRIAGAYWRGDEKNKMLVRIYGLSFNTKEELDEYLRIQEEAKKRDHRKLGHELDLFTFSPLVGPGLPLWTPKGTILRSELDAFVWQLRKAKGYQKVTIPHITKKDLYETSGHWTKFADGLFKIESREGKEFAMKPMNCPHHSQIFNHVQRSYRDMPQRYAETTMVYRDEQSGELGGLTRVLSITQDDAHVFARHNQLKQEFFAIWDIIDTFYKTFGFELKVRLSFSDPKTPEKYLGTREIWDNAENTLREITKERGAVAYEALGEAALYGPKIDFMAKDSIGREHQVATVQLDMNLPERFDLFCINENGEKERIVMLHAAIMGSIERFTAVLIEHTAGLFPLWLSPVQVKILPIASAHNEYANSVLKALKDSDIRVEIDESNETLGKKIRNAKMEKVPYIFVIGDKEIEASAVGMESRDKGSLGQIKLQESIEKLKKEIEEKV